MNEWKQWVDGGWDLQAHSEPSGFRESQGGWLQMARAYWCNFPWPSSIHLSSTDGDLVWNGGFALRVWCNCDCMSITLQYITIKSLLFDYYGKMAGPWVFIKKKVAFLDHQQNMGLVLTPLISFSESFNQPLLYVLFTLAIRRSRASGSHVKNPQRPEYLTISVIYVCLNSEGHSKQSKMQKSDFGDYRSVDWGLDDC